MPQSKSKKQVSMNKTNTEHKQSKMQGSAQLAERQNGSQFSPVRVGVHLLKTVMQKDIFNI